MTMSNMHILSIDGTNFTAAFHIPIPATNNTAGCPWRTVVLRLGGGGVTVLPDGDGTLGTISAAEKTMITSGAIVEVVQSAGWNASFPSGAQLDAIATAVSNAYTSGMQSKYAQYGATR